MKKLIGIAACSLVIVACNSGDKKQLQLERTTLVLQTKYNKEAMISAKNNELVTQRAIESVKKGELVKDTTELHNYVARKREVQDSLKKANDSMAVRITEIDALLK